MQQVPVVPPLDPLNISGQQYKEVDNITADINRNLIFDSTTKIRWPASITSLMVDSSDPKTFFQYFELMFPMSYMANIIRATQLEYDKDVDNKIVVTKGLILKFFGLILAVALHRNIGGKKGLWTENNTEGSVLFQAYRFNQRFNFTRDAYFLLSANFRLSIFTQVQLTTVREYNNIYYILIY